MTNYELLERIGSGGMAEVFRGRATAVGGFEKPVAIKRILPHLSQDDRFVRMLIGEAKLLANLRQRNIVQVYDVGVGDDGAYFLVLEYVDGRDTAALCDKLEEHGEPFPRDLALHIASEVCDALDYLHTVEDESGQRLSLVHRDISPSNVLLSRAGEIKLTDFGIAKNTSQQHSVVGNIAGKLAYMSPEQARGEAVGPPSDLYSLGVVLWELLLGRPVYGMELDLRIVDAVRNARVPRPREIDPRFPRALEDILMTALSLHPRDRFRSAATFGAALRDYRYSTTSMDDPAREIALLIQRHFDAKPVRSDQSQLLRLETRIGAEPDAFTSPGMARAGGKNKGMDFFDEPTRAAPELAKRLAEGEVRVAEASPSLPPPHLPGVAALPAPRGQPRLPDAALAADSSTRPAAPAALQGKPRPVPEDPADVAPPTTRMSPSRAVRTTAAVAVPEAAPLSASGSTPPTAASPAVPQVRWSLGLVVLVLALVGTAGALAWWVFGS